MNLTPPVGGPRTKRPFDLPEADPSLTQRAKRLLTALKERYPDAKCELNATNPHELLIATILSAQATDKGINKATPALFERFKTPEAYAAATPQQIEPFLKTVNFWRNKAKSVHGAMKMVAEHHDGKVPADMNSLLELPGVARKTANVVLGNAFSINEGVVVDTHVMRLSQRFGLTEKSDPKKIERELMTLFPRPSWCLLSHLFIFHGRRVCKARGALCSEDSICKRFCSNS